MTGPREIPVIGRAVRMRMYRIKWSRYDRYGDRWVRGSFDFYTLGADQDRAGKQALRVLNAASNYAGRFRLDEVTEYVPEFPNESGGGRHSAVTTERKEGGGECSTTR